MVHAYKLLQYLTILPSLRDNVHSIGHDWYRVSSKGLEKTSRFLKSVGRYGPSPFLWPLYGGEINQAFCRWGCLTFTYTCKHHKDSCEIAAKYQFQNGSFSILYFCVLSKFIEYEKSFFYHPPFSFLLHKRICIRSQYLFGHAGHHEKTEQQGTRKWNC